MKKLVFDLRKAILSIALFGFFMSLTNSVRGQSTWSLLEPSSQVVRDIAWVQATAMPDTYQIFAVGANGLIQRMNAEGVAWTVFNTGVTTNFRSIYMYDKFTFWVVGEDKVRYTTNGGSSWNTATISGLPTLNAIVMETLSVGWAVGATGKIFKTTNGGATWIAQTSNTTNDLFDVIPIAGTTNVIAVGANGTICRSTNSGTTWTVSTFGDGTKDVNSITSASSHLYAAGESGLIIKSIDNGVTWGVQSSGTTNFLSSISYSGGFYACGNSGTLLRSTDGTTWITVPSGRTDNFLAVTSLPTNAGYAATSTKGFMSSYGLTSCAAPTTTMVSGNITACKGDNVTITTTSTGTITTRSLKKDGVAVNVNGNTTALGNVITLTNVQPSQTGIYLVEVTSPCGNSTTASITVTVNDVPPQPATITIDNPNPSQGILYDLSVANVAGTTYAWNGGTGATITGSGNAVSVSWSSTGAKTVTVTPNNGCGTGTARTLALTVAAPLATPTLLPADNATNVSISANLNLTFSESFLSFIPGKVITIRRTADNSVFESYTLASTNVTKVNGIVTINPTAIFQESTGYYVQIEGGSITIPSAPFSGYTGILTTTGWNFTTTESTPPIITSYSPVDNATGVNVSSNLVATFSENVFPVATKMITIKKLSDNSIVHSYTLPSTNVVISGNTVTINPSSDLVANTDYYVNMDVGAFEDAAGNDFAGLTNQSTWNFVTAAAADGTPPTISSLSPLDNATDVTITSNLAVTFSENVFAVATKVVSIRRTSDNIVFESYTLPSTNVLVSGATVTINPTGSLANSTGYYVNIDAGAFEDVAGNDFAGITNTTSWSFTTVAVGDVTPPSIVSLSPVDNSINVPLSSSFVITFDENVSIANATSFRIRRVSNNAADVVITAPSPQVTVSGNMITINPDSDLPLASTDYWIEITSGVSDLSNNFFSGISTNTTWNFTTAAAALQNQTITFNVLAAKTFGDAAFALTATASSGLPVSYASSNTAVATVSGGIVTIVGTGSAIITASQTGNGSFNAAPDVQQTLTVNKANQTITFGALAAKTFGDANFSLGATASSALGVSYSSSNTAVATISGSTVTIVGAGSTTITASQVGNGSFNAAPNVLQTLTVNKASQTISFGALAAKTFGDATFNLSALTSSGLTVSYSSSNTSVATVSGNTVTIVGAGTTTITASQAGNTNFNAAANVQQTLTVNKANQTITFGPLPSKQVGDAAFGLTATASSGLTLSYASSNTAVATISGSTVTVLGAGSTTITASQAGNTNFNAATNVQQTLTVTNAAPAMAIQSLAPADNATGVDGSINLSITFNQNASVSAGTISIFRSDNDALVTSLSNFAAGITISGATVTFDFPASIPAGTGVYVNISAGYLRSAADGNNTFAGISDKTTWNFTVGKLDQTIAFGALATKTFGDANFGLTATASSGLAISYASSNTSVATISGSTVTIVGAGSTTITASQSGNTTFNAAANVQQVLTVNKANQTITFGALAAKMFGDANFTLGATASSTLGVSYTSSNASVATISGNTVTIVGAGSTIITASQAGNANFNAAVNVQQTLTVNKANQTITFGALTAKTFGDANFTLGATANSSLGVSYTSSNTSVATVSGSTVTIIGAGSTIITASQSGNANFNVATNVQQTLTVNKANQSITFSDIPAKTVGDPSFGLSATASSGLTVSFISSNTAVATVSGSAVTIVGAGSTTITASQIGNANFNAATSVDKTLVVSNPAKQNQNITFNVLASKTFGDSNFTLGATATSGLSVTYTSSNTAVATVSGSTVTILGAGTSVITANQPGNDSFSPASPVQQMLTVNKANQTITFNTLAAKTFGDADFTLNGASSASLAITYTSSNTSIATVSGNMVTMVGAGSTTITATQGGNANVNAALSVGRMLTVNKADQSIVFGSIAAKSVSDPPFALNATASSGLSVSYTSSNAAVATVSGSTVTIVSTGSTTITASQTGNANFNAATSVQQTLIVVSQTRVISLSGDMNFGELIVPESVTRVLTISNSGSATLTVSNITYPAGFSGDKTNGIITAGNTLTVNVTLSATEAKEYNGNIVITSDATSGVGSISVSGAASLVTGLEPEFSNNLKVYPNPSSSIFILEVMNPIHEVASISDQAGRVVLAVEMEKQDQGLYLINMKGQPAGLYFVKIETKKGLKMTRVMVVNQ